MKKQISELQERIAQGKVTEEVIGMLKEAQIKVANANTLLNEDIKLLKQAQYDKDRLWELELEDIQKAMSLAFPVNK